MLHSAVVPVYGKPVFHSLRIGERIIVVRVDIADKVPRRARPLRHGIGLALCLSSALRTGAVDERIYLCERRLAALARLEILNIGQTERKLIIGNTDHAALRAVHDRDRLAPIALTVERPVLHLVLNTALAYSLLLEVVEHTLDRVLFVRIAVEEIGVYHTSVAGVCSILDIASLDNRDNINTEFTGKVVVALIVCGNSHDGARSVAHHNIVGDIDRYLGSGDGIYRADTVETNARLVLDELRTLKLGLFRTFLAVCADLVHIGNAVGMTVDDWMLGRNYHKGNAEQRIRTGGIDAQTLIKSGKCEIDKRSGRASYPVLLLHTDICGVIDVLKTVEQLIGICGYAQIPHILGALNDLAVAYIALAALRILIREDALA